jgi:hypothetical protein
VGFGEKQTAQLRTPVWGEAVLHTGEAQRSDGFVQGVEDGCGHAPASFDDQARIDGITRLAGVGDPGLHLGGRMGRAVDVGQVGRGQVTLYLGL